MGKCKALRPEAQKVELIVKWKTIIFRPLLLILSTLMRLKFCASGNFLPGASFCAASMLSKIEVQEQRQEGNHVEEE